MNKEEIQTELEKIMKSNRIITDKNITIKELNDCNIVFTEMINEYINANELNYDFQDSIINANIEKLKTIDNNPAINIYIGHISSEHYTNKYMHFLISNGRAYKFKFENNYRQIYTVNLFNYVDWKTYALKLENDLKC